MYSVDEKGDPLYEYTWNYFFNKIHTFDRV